MLSNEDLLKIGSFLSGSEQRINQRMDSKFAEMEVRITASEDRVLRRMDDNIKVAESRIMRELGNFFEQVITPQFDTLSSKADKIEARLDGIDRKLDRNLDKELVQDGRLDKIESVPVVAHALKAI